MGVFSRLQPAVNIIHTNQVSDGEFLHMHVGKNYKAEINSLKYTSKTERLYSTAPLSLEEDFTVPATQKGATSLYPQS